MQQLDKARLKLQRQITKDGIVELRCPQCGTLLRTQAGQANALCFGCGRPADLHAAERNAMAQAAREGIRHYTDLLDLAAEQLEQGSYTVAAETYTLCCAIHPDSGDAWRGLLLADTENFRKVADPPLDLFARARMLLPAAESQQLRRQWEAYTAYVRSKEQFRADRRRRDAQREDAPEARAGEAGEKRRFSGRALARALILTACIAGGICLLFTGTGFLMIMGAAMLSTLGRRREP